MLQEKVIQSQGCRFHGLVGTVSKHIIICAPDVRRTDENFVLQVGYSSDK